MVSQTVMIWIFPEELYRLVYHILLIARQLGIHPIVRVCIYQFHTLGLFRGKILFCFHFDLLEELVRNLIIPILASPNLLFLILGKTGYICVVLRFRKCGYLFRSQEMIKVHDILLDLFNQKSVVSRYDGDLRSLF